MKLSLGSLIALALAVVTLVWYISTRNARIDALELSLALSEQNRRSLDDTLRTERNARGEIESARLIQVGELEELSDSLRQQLSRLDGDLEVAIAARLRAESHDTVRTIVVQDSSSKSATWTFEPDLPAGNRLFVEGRASSVEEMIAVWITGWRLELELTVGIREREDGLREAVATSTFPGLERIDVRGAILEPELVYRKAPRSWTVPAAIGFAIGVIGWELVR